MADLGCNQASDLKLFLKQLPVGVLSGESCSKLEGLFWDSCENAGFSG